MQVRKLGVYNERYSEYLDSCPVQKKTHGVFDSELLSILRQNSRDLNQMSAFVRTQPWVNKTSYKT